MKHNDQDLRWKISDILGFEVFNQQGIRLGFFCDIMSTNSSDIWVVKDCNEKILIPALKGIVKDVNVTRKKIFITLPKEYDDIYGCIRSADGVFSEHNGYFTYED
ncbi:MAG: hypothetical protein LBC05_01750 [Endomicrobium sp.]|jgi:16S rRNA processing protein RimM|nr:hypothetical protein [Endomicrobium sp.]